MSMPWQLLDWDSRFFGFGVVRVDPALDAAALEPLLAMLKQQGVRLVYWPAAQTQDAALIDGLGGALVDRKTTFSTGLPARGASQVTTEEVRPYAHDVPLAELEYLAVQSGQYSRYALDPRIPPGKFAELYRLWIGKAVQALDGEATAQVLLIRDGGITAGMVTLGEKQGIADIGLIAVHPQHRGKRYGEKLVTAAQQWFVTRAFCQAQVVTQGDNLPACRLYGKCGYTVSRVENFYHFWL
jgi:dTDP-4-amino-4,6-dideoxy-D-galactose acyltransferase